MLNSFIVSLLRGAPYVESHDSPGHHQMPGRSWRAGQAQRRIAQHPEQSGPFAAAGAHASVARNRKGKNKFSFSLGFHYISRLAAANIGCASEE